MKKSIKSEILKTDQLTEYDLKEMYALFQQYYVEISFEQFCIDLREKTHLFRLRDQLGLVGFSTIFRRKFPEIDRRATFLFSGDTVIREDYWGSKVLQMIFFRYILESKLRSPFAPVYWMLISKSYKTYMMMKRNFASSWPCPVNAIPSRVKEIKDGFYRIKFGKSYNPDTGLITFERSMGSVKGAAADPSPEGLRDPRIAHFLALNPSYKNGVELACITEIRFSDFARHIPKYFLKAKERKVEAPQELEVSAFQGAK